MNLWGTMVQLPKQYISMVLMEVGQYATRKESVKSEAYFLRMCIIRSS